MREFYVYDFGYRLRDLRESRNLTQEQVGKAICVHKNTIGAYENNVKTSSIKIIIKLANFYRTSIDYILGLKNEEIVYIHDLSIEKQKMVFEFIKILEKQKE